MTLGRELTYSDSTWIDMDSLAKSSDQTLAKQIMKFLKTPLVAYIQCSKLG